MMDVEKLIEQLSIRGLGNGTSLGYHSGLFDEAATAIETLQAENAQLRAKVEQERDHRIHAEQHADAFLKDCERLDADLARVTAERDGAVKDLKKWNICATCGHYSPYGKKSNCKIKSAHISGGNWAGCSKWEWRGNQKED